jgi:hypothetical protein
MLDCGVCGISVCFVDRFRFPIDDKAIRWNGLGVAALLAYRALSSSAVVVDHWGIETHSMMRTHRYAFTDLNRVEVAVGRTGMTGFDREYLLIHRRDGRDIAFKALNCRRSKGDAVSVVARAAVSKNTRLTA